MAWLIVFGLCCLAGLLRFLDGAGSGENPWAAKVPGLVFTILIGLSVATVAYLVSTSYIAAAVAGINGAICIHLGQTHWESWKWQSMRGLVFALPPIIYLYASGTPFAWLNVLSICSSFTIAYVVYYWTENGNGKTIHPHILLPWRIEDIETGKITWGRKVIVLGHWEQWCRFIQGFFICLSSACL